MIYTAIDTFYLTDEQLKTSPSRKDGIDEATETTLRIYGCDLIQESGILLKLPQAVMATGQVLFHRFYCKKSFARGLQLVVFGLLQNLRKVLGKQGRY